MKIELLPTSSNSDVKSRIEGLLLNCKSFKSCVSFWTLKVDYFKFDALSEALKKTDSFICVDLEKPTNIDNIFEFNNNGVSEIYLHRFRISSTLTNLDNIHLLHSKVYLFEMEDNKVEIWIGSHNLTQFALSGLNLESSISVECNKSDKFYKDVLNYLNDVKQNFCFKFDRNYIDVYRKLQSRTAEKATNGIEIHKVVSLVGFDMNSLKEEKIIQLLSFNVRDFKNFKNNDEIFLHCFDINRSEEYLYKCSIRQIGILDEDIEKLKLEFINKLRFSYLGTGLLSILHPESKIDDSLLKRIKTFIKLEVEYKIPNFHVFEKPKKEFSFWTKDSHEYLSRRYNFSSVKEINILKATMNRGFIDNTLSLGNHWNFFNTNYKMFYLELDNLLMQQINDLECTDSVKSKNLVEQFIIRIKKEVGINDYNKAVIDRCIYFEENNR